MRKRTPPEQPAASAYSARFVRLIDEAQRKYPARARVIKSEYGAKIPHRSSQNIEQVKYILANLDSVFADAVRERELNPEVVMLVAERLCKELQTRTGLLLDLRNTLEWHQLLERVFASKPVDPGSEIVNQSGREARQAIEEAKKIKSLARVRKLSISQIQSQYPDFIIWKMAEKVPSECRETFENPRQWEPGFIRNVFLPKCYGRSLATIKKWLPPAKRKS